MVNRHFLRQKVLQSLYAYFVDDDKDISKQEKFLFANIFRIYDLEIYLISSIFEVLDIENERIEAAKQKFYPTEEEKNPDLRFVQNAFTAKLRSNGEIGKSIEKLHINWAAQKNMFDSILLAFKKCHSYKEYFQIDNPSYEQQKRIIVQLFKNYIMPNSDFYDVLCERGFTWESDYDYVCQIVLQLLKTWQEDEQDDKILPYPFDKEDENEVETDRDYARNLFENTIKNDALYEKYIDKVLKNWDRDRLALMDVLIVKMAMSEFIYCPTIPLRVTLNEYIELAKEFSTKKSFLFVNGLMDKLITILRVDDKIHKEENESLYFENAGEKNLGYYTNTDNEGKNDEK